MDGQASSLSARSVKVSDYLALMKPRVMSLAVFTAVVGMALAPASLSPLAATAAVICIALGAGACGALNMWYDRDIDRLMARTAARPIPTGRVAPAHAAGFGLALALGSVTVLGLVTNWTAAALLALTIVYYIGVYTAWLKRRTPQSVVVGGVAGALPPVIGWTAGTGSVDAGAAVLFAIIFLWTPPHSWALALFRGGDFAKADLPLLRTPERERGARRQILLYALLLFPVTLAPAALGVASPVYAAVAAALGSVFVTAAWRLRGAAAGEIDRRARALFGYSILYLFLIFAALLIDRAAARLLDLA